MDFWDNLWNVFWLFFWGFALLAYLLALFSVIGDIFRDRELGGLGKAIWLLFLFFLPFLTLLAYLIVRGNGMAARSVGEARQFQSETESYIRQVAGFSPADEIAKAKALLDAGTITQPEYEALKTRILTA